MMVWVSIISGIFILFILLLFSRIYTSLYYIHKGGQDFLKVELRLWRIKVVEKELPMVNFDPEQQSVKTKESTKSLNKSKQEDKNYSAEEMLDNMKRIKEFVRKVINLRQVIQSYLAKVRIHKFYWHTELGTGDAGTTGMLCGGVWSVKGGVLGLLASHTKLLMKPVIVVNPLFSHKFAYTQLECIFSVRLGQTIYAFIQLARHFKGDFSEWASETV